ncbi:MAG: hypothetical protein PUF08_00615 [Clostridiales bacterium]|nr:hypothetical protein [Clostridiales bacterium]
MNDVAFSMRLVNTGIELRKLSVSYASSSVFCTNDVVLDTFSECRNRTA